MHNLFNVYEDPNEDYLKMSFESYFDNKNSISLMYLLKNTLAYALIYTPLNEINLEFKDFGSVNAYAFYKDNLISVNEKILNLAENENVIPLAMFSIFHELCHAMLIKRNIDIYRNKEYSMLFVPNYDMNAIEKVFYKITKDKNLALGASQYFYLKNKNEQIAFIEGGVMAQNILDYFASEKNFKVPNGIDILNNKMEFLKDHFPFVVNNEKLLLDLLEKYQISMLSKGLKKLTIDEQVELTKTTYVNLSNNTRIALLSECYKAKNVKVMAGMLSNPLLKITDNEKRILAKVYGTEVISDLTYRDADLEKNYAIFTR